ncbi:MAG: hypothetical protein M1820_004060 [Bogoriella megaspora]|nr:MAG: hypothetical protein M1820_004060 [Bogoriella megaspora]
MARTRASISKKEVRDEINTAANEEQQEATDTDTKVEEAVEDGVAKPSSFKNRLESFQYVASTSPNSERRTFQTSITSFIRPSQTSPLKRALSSPSKPSKTPSASPTPPTKRRKSSKYAPPSTYSHLAPLTDILTPNLITVFIGTNPGIMTSTAGHAYAHPSNLFWRLLHSSGLTSRRLSPEEDVDLPRLYAMGNTNIIDRPSRNAGELSQKEYVAGAGVLEEKIAKWRPESVCMVGKGIWEGVWRRRRGRGFNKGEFKYGWQDERENMGRSKDWKGARVFVATSTSGLSASTTPAEKEAILKPFGEWVMKRRLEKFGNEGEGDYLDALWEGKEDMRESVDE